MEKTRKRYNFYGSARSISSLWTLENKLEMGLTLGQQSTNLGGSTEIRKFGLQTCSASPFTAGFLGGI